MVVTTQLRKSSRTASHKSCDHENLPCWASSRLQNVSNRGLQNVSKPRVVGVKSQQAAFDLPKTLRRRVRRSLAAQRVEYFVPDTTLGQPVLSPSTVARGAGSN